MTRRGSTRTAYAEGPAAHLFADPDGLPPAAALAALGEHLAGVFTGACALRHREPGERPVP
ncbi:hypothetical protein DCW30_14070 [Streptomyces alfalfae]|uniref:Uncharacterized protein n=1 Tax=Streptomyces alfalfae TaxID=1642299 RepID=A0A1P8TPD6_9ACTN|nr:hypothetical protein [Streptomyces alfalfae]APY89442.1 hypothetical protein A7J05_30480 [Streptomyces alfalfae]QQC88127.1 hypothetical protein I8755_06665 [Streptomyces alfalfae]QUI30526.1 hypothetical protein H9W91_06370 [Streptomyces alfalfae]RXX43986.1 hypothetical protein DCW30_14070 [Streptomyces alfalfae]RZN04112.1 hypothetical protein D4104_03360 [Streptomyces alfalfae]